MGEARDRLERDLAVGSGEFFFTNMNIRTTELRALLRLLDYVVEYDESSGPCEAEKLGPLAIDECISLGLTKGGDDG